ncbi:MAG: Cof-type HAD-IIB family hydrolase [Lachnospiraceae bacterium]|nr:Cof-type HAD-IIB family hydrolase [Lachnospiraceae bacterium]
MDCKVLLFDLDGTLLQSDKTISPGTLAVLQMCRAKGVLIGVSTSRSEKNSFKFISELCPDILISSGGALVKYSGEYVYKAEFTVEETADMIRTAREICGDCEITIDTVNDHYWNYKVDPGKTDPSWGESIYTDFVDFEEKALKMCVETSKPDQAKKLADVLPDCDCVKFVDGDWYKFTKKTATKEAAILRLCDVCGISTDNIMAFGDDLVDIGMLKLCGMGVAMGNALEKVKNVADVVIGSNDNEGISEYLRELLKNDFLI